MADYYDAPIVSEEDLASWLDGMMTPEEEEKFQDFAFSDEATQEVLDANDDVDDEYENLVETGYDLPEEMYGDFSLPVIDNMVESESNLLYDDADTYYNEDNGDDKDEDCHQVDQYDDDDIVF